MSAPKRPGDCRSGASNPGSQPPCGVPESTSSSHPLDIPVPTAVARPDARRDVVLSRRRLILVGMTGVVTAATACSATQARAGVYLSSPVGARPTWVGAPGGIPVWSPRGDQIVWGTEDGILRSRLDGAPVDAIWAAPVAGRPAWSPDGSELALVDRDRAQLTVIGAETGRIRFELPVANLSQDRPLLGVMESGGPAWGPDGKLIAFNCWDGAGDEVCVVGSDGSNRRQITQIRPPRSRRDGPAGANTGPPAWSPDGKVIAVASFAERTGAAAGIYVIDLNAARARRLTTLVPNSEIGWFADGKSIAFAARRRGRSDVFRVSSSGGEPQPLTQRLSGGSWDPAVQPAADGLAAVTSDGIVILEGDTSELIPGAPGMRASGPAWSSNGTALAFQWVPDLIANYD